MEGQKDNQHGVSSGTRQPDGASGLTLMAGPLHITMCGTSPLTQKARGPEKRNKFVELNKLAGNPAPQGSGVKRAQYPGSCFRATPIIDTV